MKHTYILIISSLLALILGFGCEKGPQGDVGPVGDKGPQGNAGVNNTTAGPKGQQGLQGPTGPAGQRGPSGTDGQAGVANLVITNWQKIVWKNYNTITAGTYALFGEIALPELTQRVIDKGHVEVQVRFNNDNQQISSPNYIGTNFLLNNDSYWIELHGVKLGKVVFRIDLFDVPTATFIELLNNHPIEARASILIN